MDLVSEVADQLAGVCGRWMRHIRIAVALPLKCFAMFLDDSRLMARASAFWSLISGVSVTPCGAARASKGC